MEPKVASKIVRKRHNFLCNYPEIPPLDFASFDCSPPMFNTSCVLVFIPRTEFMNTPQDGSAVMDDIFPEKRKSAELAWKHNETRGKHNNLTGVQ